MSLRLSRVAEHQLIETSHAMLSPLAYRDRASWLLEVNRRIRGLFDAEVTLKVETRAGQVSLVSQEDPGLAEAYQRFAFAEAGLLRSRDGLLDAGLMANQVVAPRPFTSGTVDLLSGGAVTRAPLNQEIAVPRGLFSSVGLRSPCAGGELMLVAFRRQAEPKPFDTQALALLRILTPAFGAGLLALDRFEAGRKALWQLWEECVAGVIVLEAAGGRELYRNRAIDRMLGPAAGGAELASALLGAMPDRTGAPRPGSSDLTEVATRDGGYRLSRSSLPAAVVSPHGAWLILIESTSPRLPTAEALQRRWRLTAREAQIALILATGQSDVEIGRQLGLSPHTIRHHVEHIFDKLGVRTRKALALHLLSPVG